MTLESRSTIQPKEPLTKEEVYESCEALILTFEGTIDQIREKITLVGYQENQDIFRSPSPDLPNRSSGGLSGIFRNKYNELFDLSINQKEYYLNELEIDGAHQIILDQMELENKKYLTLVDYLKRMKEVRLSLN